MFDKDDKGDDRRRFFRIEDHVALRVREIPPGELETEVSRMQLGLPDRIGLASTFASTSQQMRHLLEKFRRDQPDLAGYLEELNGKLDLLIQLLAVHENEMPDRPTHHVQLSASGIAYRTDEPPPMGATLELMLLLFPSFTCLRLFGTVVNSVPAKGASEGATQVGVNFTHIRETDRELIIRHVVQRQSVLLREARIALDPDP
jgi:hypothetical protein